MNKTLTLVKYYSQIILCCLLALLLNLIFVASCALSTSTPTSDVMPAPTEGAATETFAIAQPLVSPPTVQPAAATNGLSIGVTAEMTQVRIMQVTLAPLYVLLQTPIPSTPILLPTAQVQQTARNTQQVVAQMVTQTITPVFDLLATTPTTATGPDVHVAPRLLVPTPTPMAVITATESATDSVHVPILMYHYLSKPPADADIYRLDLSVPPDLFAAHLDRLVAEGYTTISLYDLMAHFNKGASLPAKPVIITFDDGYRDNYTNALPLLRARRMTATFFLVTDFINQERPAYVSWEMVREMYADGMSIEAHGVDHSSLRRRSNADLEFQALRSYETIENRIGVRPRFVSYPAGEYDEATIAMFQSAGYWAGVTTKQGATHTKDKLFELRRVRIRGTTTADELARLLRLNW